MVDFRCRAHVEPLGPEEPNATHGIVFVRGGVFRRVHRGQELLADANHLLFFNAGEGYRYAHPLPGGDACTILSLDGPRALELVAARAPGDAQRPEWPFRHGHALNTARAARLLYELIALADGDASGLSVEDTVAELADAALASAYASRGPARARTSPAGRRRRRDLAEAAKVCLNQHGGGPLALGALAARLGCSPFHLSRTFRAEAGISLRRYAARLRALRAAELLREGPRDLTALALTLGYADHSHFTNTFRREWGVPPSRFRAQARAAGKIVQAGALRPR